MILERVTVGAFAENTYLVGDARSREAVLVDPGAEPDRLLATVKHAGVTLTAIWLTHAHLDHVGGIAGVKRVWDVPVHLHPLDAPVYAYAERSAAAYGIPYEAPPPPDRELADGEPVRVGRHAFDVWHVPGHAPGHVVFIAGDVMLCGDLVFAGSIGRVDLPMSDPRAMQQSLERLSTLPDTVAVHPGHGPSTTMREERRSNPFLSGAVRVRTR